MAGEKGVTECTFVETNQVVGATPVTLVMNGVATIHDYGKVNSVQLDIKTLLP